MRSYLSIEPDPFPAPRCAVAAAARTDRGLERENNEDRAAFADLGAGLAFEPPASADVAPTRGFLGLVCDGMGGEAGGEIASRLAVETIVPFLIDVWRETARGALGEGAIARALVASVEAASARIKAEAVREPRYSRMGTTATLATLVGRSLVCAQVGDSRAYLHRAREIFQLTRDQTMAELLRRNAPPSDVGEIVGSNIILQAVGSSVKLDVAITHASLEAGDTILLCSDGLSGVVEDEVLARTLNENVEPSRACAELVARALERGAPDNVTCVVFRVA